MTKIQKKTHSRNQVVTFADLGRFTEEITLPGVERIVDRKMRPMIDILDGVRADVRDIKITLGPLVRGVSALERDSA